MENFKEIAEKCLAGELSGTFVLRNGKEINSEGLIRYNSIYYPYTFFDKPFTYTNSGSIYNGVASSHECDIVNFIPDNMQKKIEIDIPEGKVPVMEPTESGVVITWKEKELTYTEIFESLLRDNKAIYYIANTEKNEVSDSFIRKADAIRKLINIRNYFGKPDENKSGWFIEQSVVRISGLKSKYYPNIIMFAEKKHAEQAIKMLGDELKYLFEPW